MLDDRTTTTEFDAHYVYMGAWAMRHLAAARPAQHVDIGGQISWVTCAAALCPVVFIDVRPFTGAVPNLDARAGDILALPFPDRSLSSLSCLHVAEHIGLGRYGDPIDPLGTRKAVAELARVLAPGGILYFALPVGQPRVVFNAHRVHDPEAIVSWMSEQGLALAEFAAVDDAGRFDAASKVSALKSQRYACGMFVFRRPA